MGGEKEPRNEADAMPCPQALMGGETRMKLALTVLLSTTHTGAGIPVW